MSFESDVATFMGTAEIKKMLRAHYTQMAKSGLINGSGGFAECKADALKYAEAAKSAIIASLPDVLKKKATGLSSSGTARPITENDLICKDVMIDDNGDFYVEMDWNPQAVRRDSLYLDGDNDHIDDIVRLFANGYPKAKNYAYGYWAGHGPSMQPTRSLLSRPAMPFLQYALAQFNSAHSTDNVKLYIRGGYLK